MSGYKLPMEVEATIQHQAGEIMRLKQQLAELQAKYDAREQECRTAFGKEMELRKQLAECERERDLHYSRLASIIFSAQMKDVFSRDILKWHSEYVDAQKELAECERERDEWKEASLINERMRIELREQLSTVTAERDEWKRGYEMVRDEQKDQAALAKLGADKTGEV